MSLTQEQKSRLRETSYPAAIALAEDMEYIRTVLAQHMTSRGELRRLSGILRRLLVERDLVKVAVPRLGARLTLNAPDRNPVYNHAKRMRCLFFASGGTKVFGCRIGMMAMWNAGNIPPPKHGNEIFSNDLLNGSRTISLRLDNFLTQRVLCYHGNWISRGAVIKHIANVGSGVHSGDIDDPKNAVIERMRSSCVYRVRDGELEVHVLPELGENSAKWTMKPDSGEPPLDFQASDLDVVLMENLAAAELLSASPDVQTLEEIVWREIESRQTS